MPIPIHIAPFKRFMTKYDRVEPTVRDATVMTAFDQCKRKYFFKFVLGFRQKGTSNPPYITFGSAYHTFREVLEKNKDDSKNFEMALQAAADTWNKGGGDPTVGTDYDYLTGERLFKSCLVAHKHWLKEKEMNRIVVFATEQEFILTLKDGKTLIGGRADQVVKWGEKPWGRDFKTTSKSSGYYQRLIDPNDQVYRYTYAESKLTGERVQGQIIELLYNTKKEGPKIIPLTIALTQGQLDRWEEEQIFLEQILEVCRNNDMYPASEAHCAFCEFHSTCKSVSESAMMANLEANFTRKQWDFTRSSEPGE